CHTSLPFGMKTTPSALIRLINHIFDSDEDRKILINYFDDFLIGSKTEVEHMEHLDRILAKFESNSLTIKLDKCGFMLKEVNFLDHIID
ncbi:reverse transcriptase domain-containing protein, partial [Streptococcus anginosus]|uniref:reverse transcriptase domain-containing protein n=1 Tax=Streptococcus anginosus TaxID=1328 RepID=UPI003AF78B8F